MKRYIYIYIYTLSLTTLYWTPALDMSASDISFLCVSCAINRKTSINWAFCKNRASWNLQGLQNLGGCLWLNLSDMCLPKSMPRNPKAGYKFTSLKCQVRLARETEQMRFSDKVFRTQQVRGSRGRFGLLQGWNRGHKKLWDDDLQNHKDQCLDCRVFLFLEGGQVEGGYA